MVPVHVTGVHFLRFSQPPASDKPAAREALDPPRGSVVGEGAVAVVWSGSTVKSDTWLTPSPFPAFIHVLSMACTMRAV